MAGALFDENTDVYGNGTTLDGCNNAALIRKQILIDEGRLANMDNYRVHTPISQYSRRV